MRPALESTDAVILIPMDRNRRGSVAARTVRATAWLWSRGIYPSPAAVGLRMHGRARRDLNGIETKARNGWLDARKDLLPPPPRASSNIVATGVNECGVRFVLRRDHDNGEMWWEVTP